MSGPAPLEIEARRILIGSDRGADLDALSELGEVAGLRCGGFELRRQHDRYFDLPEGALVARDCALRLRQVDDALLVTFKGPSRKAGEGVVARVEVEVPWSPSALDAVRPHLAALGVELEGSARSTDAEQAFAELGLRCVQERRTDRRATALERGATPVAELVLDEVVYVAGERRVLHREVEVEALGDTGAEEVLRIARALEARSPGSLRAWPWSKTAVGVALDALAAAGELEGDLVGDELTVAAYDRVDAWLSKASC